MLAELAGNVLSEACWREKPSRERCLPGGPELQGWSRWAGEPGCWYCVPLSLKLTACLFRGLSPSVSQLLLHLLQVYPPLPASKHESSRARSWISSLAGYVSQSSTATENILDSQIYTSSSSPWTKTVSSLLLLCSYLRL